MSRVDKFLLGTGIMTGKIFLKDFEDAIRCALLVKPKAKYENRKPTAEELKCKWRLVAKKRKP